jgi:ribonucleotide reductase alpha subunit
MYVTKRSGEREIVSFDKILTRIKNQGTFGSKAYPLPPLKINYTTLAMKVIDQLYDGISTSKIDELSAEQCASMASVHPDYNALAGRITVSNHQKNTSASFSEVMTALYQYVDKNGKPSPLVSRELYDAVQVYGQEFDALCDYGRDYDIDYFGFKTLERAYLMKINKKTVERPQHMWLRVAIGIHVRSKTTKSDIDQYSDLDTGLMGLMDLSVDFSDWPGTFDHIKQTYDHMSQKYFTHATPTLFNAGTPHPQLSSCFLLAMEKDSIEGIYNTLKDCALISKWAGGIGLHIHNIRATGSHIRGTNGQSNGIVPMLRVFNNTAKYVDQCVAPETLIYTDQGPIPIWKTVSGQTKVFGKTGKLETVQNVLEYSYSGEMVEIDMRPSAGEPGFNFNDLFTIFDDNTKAQPFSPSTLKITPEHPIYILRNYADETEDVIQNDLALGLAALEWTEAKNITTEDLIVYSVPDHIQDHAELTEELCYFYGVMLNALATEKEHRLQKRTVYAFPQEQENPWLILEFNTLQYKVIDELCEFLTGRLVKYTKTVDEDITSFIIETTLNLPYRISDFFDLMGQNQTVRSPKIGQRWLFLPHYKTQCILNGLLYNQANTHVSSILQPQIAFLNLRMGKIYNNYGLGTNMQEPAFFHYQNYLLRKVTDVSTKPYTGYVYDLQMTTEHNYLLEHGLVHNGGGKRNGSFAIYLEPWHADIEMFLQMRKNHGDEELKARDLFYALWVPDLFMERIKTDGQWTLMCPDECPGLAEVYGQDFVDLYTKYEQDGKGRKSVRARDLWFQVLDAQMETGTPYLLYKDACNKKSNQQNIGTIKSSNLCSEIIQYSDENESAVCNLASIALPRFIKKDADDNKTFDYDKLHEVARMVTYNLNQIIDVNYYPTEKTRRSNMRHRPIGIGIQGLADVFMMMDLPFASEKSKEINKLIFETIYHGALTESCELAKKHGQYETFPGSPASKGQLQFDLWNVDPVSVRYNWTALKRDIQANGLRNSLLLSPMPTASTSQILGYNECIEPITSNIYSRRTIAGEFIMANRYLMSDLIKLDLWNEKIKNSIIANHGSIQHIDIIPETIREKYKTVWEIPMRNLIDMAADRGAYICQSQSLNLWLEDPTYSMLTSMHFYSWSKGLKTGIYYLRRRAKHQAQQFTIEPEKAMLSQQDEEICEMCSS